MNGIGLTKSVIFDSLIKCVREYCHLFSLFYRQITTVVFEMNSFISTETASNKKIRVYNISWWFSISVQLNHLTVYLYYLGYNKYCYYYFLQFKLSLLWQKLFLSRESPKRRFRTHLCLITVLWPCYSKAIRGGYFPLWNSNFSGLLRNRIMVPNLIKMSTNGNFGQQAYISVRQWSLEDD